MLYNQILTLLTTPPGNLVYHLVLAFSIAGAFPGALSLWLRSRLNEGRRLLLGFGLLMLSQVCLIALAGLAAYFPTYNAWLPVVDRTVTAFNLVVLIWMWAFSTPGNPSPAGRNPANLASILLGALVLLLAVFTGIWSPAVSDSLRFNGSSPDLLWSGFTIALALFGSLVVIRRRPPGFETGLAVFLLHALGAAVHILLPLPESDYPGAIRLAQIAAYPLLLTLPSRLGHPGGPGVAEGFSGASDRAGIQPHIFHHFLSLSTKTAQLELSQAISAAVAHAIPADLCLLFSPPDANKVISIHSGYDLASGEYLPAATFDGQLLPVIAEALRQGRPLHLPAGGNIPDLAGLANILNLTLSGSLLLSPVTSPSGEVLMALVLLSPYTGCQWTAQDQNYLASIAVSVGEIILRAQVLSRIEEKLAQADRAVQNLQLENTRLSEALQELSQRDSLPADVENLQAELRAALEETLLLKQSLAETGQKELAGEPFAFRDADRLDTIAALAQDLHQPVTSILGYADLLLGESLGSLSASQQKMVERLKANAARLNRLADGLMKATQESGPSESPDPLPVADPGEIMPGEVLE